MFNFKKRFGFLFMAAVLLIGAVRPQPGSLTAQEQKLLTTPSDVTCETAVIPVWYRGDGTIDNPFQAWLIANFLGTYVDITGQLGENIPPSPPVFMVQYTGDPAILTAIMSNPQYSVYAPVWIEDCGGIVHRKPRTVIPTDGEFLGLRQFLTRIGLTIEERNLAVGEAVCDPDCRTREQIAEQFKAWARTLTRDGGLAPRAEGGVYILRDSRLAPVLE